MSSPSLYSLGIELQQSIDEIINCGELPLDGHALQVAGVVSIARRNCLPVIKNQDVLARMSTKINSGSSTIYGVHTGFGGSADTRTDDTQSLEVGLMQLLQSGVLVGTDLDVSENPWTRLESHAMPRSWTKATVAVRLNQCIRGHSAISQDTIKALLKLIQAGITPIVPLRGTISASGDLMPLAYVAGLLEGSPDVFVFHGDGKLSRIMSAHDALVEVGLRPLVLGPREGLGLANGTAASAATASLAIADAVQLTLLATAITCLVSEALAARVEWLHPFIAETRPHQGQREVSDIMRNILQGSQLVTGLESVGRPSLNTRPRGGLSQDRYPLRTSPQWLGPQFEDLQVAYSVISIELNSTTDNPIINPSNNGSIHHGGNFQATSITSAVEKIRNSLQMIGKLLSTQCTEMINHHMNSGLPPNLAADDPSASFCCKGLDISIAAYQSELSYLSNTMSNHVQSAEMHNQAVNSLAFLSARYTMQAVELCSLIISSVLYAACQALDLRVLHATFLQNSPHLFCRTYARILGSDIPPESLETSLTPALCAFQDSWWAHSASDAFDRCSYSTAAFVHALCEPSSPEQAHCLNTSARKLREVQDTLQAELLQAYQVHREDFLLEPTTERYLGVGSKVLYRLVRSHLDVPVNRGLEDHPSPSMPCGKRTIGSHVSKIYQAVRSGELFGRFVAATQQTELDSASSTETPISNGWAHNVEEH